MPNKDWGKKPENRPRVRAIGKRFRENNKEKLAAKNRDWKKGNAAWYERQRAKKYGMTVDELNRLIEFHDAKCSICESTERLVVDHDHKTKEVRGILCNACNLGLAHFRDRPELLKSAITYLNLARLLKGKFW